MSHTFIFPTSSSCWFFNNWKGNFYFILWSTKLMLVLEVTPPSNIKSQWNINGFETKLRFHKEWESRNLKNPPFPNFYFFPTTSWRRSDGWPQPFVQPATQRLHWIVATSQNILPAFDFTNKSWRQFFAWFEIILFFLPLFNCQKYVSNKQTNICFTF